MKICYEVQIYGERARSFSTIKQALAYGNARGLSSEQTRAGGRPSYWLISSGGQCKGVVSPRAAR